MPKLSAGLLPYRRIDGDIEVLIGHPGGPMWSGRDAGAWSVLKGAREDDESELLEAARREFAEETGHPAPRGPFIGLGEVRMRSRKIVHAWAVEAEFDPSTLRSMRVEVEWPPRSGRLMSVPEIDRVAWCRPADARRLLNTAQALFVDRLLRALEGDRPVP